MEKRSKIRWYKKERRTGKNKMSGKKEIVEGKKVLGEKREWMEDT